MIASIDSYKDLNRIWAKSPEPGASQGEGLREHTMNLVEGLKTLARLRPDLHHQFDIPRLWLILLCAGWLHDWGKSAASFQRMLRGGQVWHHRHEVLSLLWVDWCCAGLDSKEATWLAATIVSHHKDAHEIFELYPFGLHEEDDPLQDLANEVDQKTCRILWQWQHHEAKQLLKNPDNMALFGGSIPSPPPWDEAISKIENEGVRRIRHWLGCYRELVNDLESRNETLSTVAGFLLRGHLMIADHTASARIKARQSIDLSSERILKVYSLDQDSLYDHQQKAAKTLGSALLVAPTGSGKTEAALLWAAYQKQRRESGLARLFYTLPYQASMNAMFDRLQSAFPRQVSLIHSRALVALYRRFMDQDYSPGEATRLARSLRDLARLHVQPVSVFSPYQMLKVVYRLRGHEAMLTDYAQGAFIFDEIHAYEPKRLAMILETLKYLREGWGARFMVMSATLPSPVKEQVIEALGDPELINATRELFKAFSRHQIHVLQGDMLDEQNIARISEEWYSGKAVLVTCNTVPRAQSVYWAMMKSPQKPREGEIILLHSRFNGRDRLTKESRLVSGAALRRTEPEGKDQRPLMVVSTQVVEVSLNIDMDTIYSDPAPLEALIQRFGRVNRRRRLPIAPVYVFDQPVDGHGIYDPGLVEKTLEVLTQNVNRPLDEAQLQIWLDEIYTGEILKGWKKLYASTAAEFRASFLDTLIPYTSDPSLEEAFDRLFDGVEVLPIGLKEEYQSLASDNPLGAVELLVPIRWGRYHSFVRKGRASPKEGNMPPVVDVYYDPELGLDLERKGTGEPIR